MTGGGTDWDTVSHTSPFCPLSCRKSVSPSSAPRAARSGWKIGLRLPQTEGSLPADPVQVRDGVTHALDVTSSGLFHVRVVLLLGHPFPNPDGLLQLLPGMVGELVVVNL